MNRFWPWLLLAAAVIVNRMSKGTDKQPDMKPNGGTKSGVRGIRNNNPGNIRKGSQRIWEGEIYPGADPSFSEFKTMAYGVRALLIDLVNKHKKGLRTVQSIIYKYAPPTENYSKVYAEFVADRMGLDVNEAFSMTPNNWIKFAKAIARFENGNAASLINAQAWEEGERRAMQRTDIAQYVENQ